MKPFLYRSFTLCLGASTQVLMLSLFVLAFPRFDETPSAWAADYFLSIAVVSSISMFFGFELRKRTAAADIELLPEYNSKRLVGAILALMVGILTLPVIAGMSLVADFGIYLSVLFFKLFNDINDQLKANYEALDKFSLSLSTNVVKTVLFAFVSLVSCWYFKLSPHIGIVFGTISFAVIWIWMDRPALIEQLRWSKGGNARLTAEDITTGFGAFLISLSVSLPRVIATTLIGEFALIMLGVGHSLNRIGQLISGAFTQTFIALKKRKVSAISKESYVIFLMQAVTFLMLAALYPIWEILFSYANQSGFIPLLIMILIYGLCSQLNYVFQSINLIKHGGKAYLKSPIAFLVTFSVALFVVWLTVGLDVYNLVGCLIFSRIIQLGVNVMFIRFGDRSGGALI